MTTNLYALRATCAIVIVAAPLARAQRTVGPSDLLNPSAAEWLHYGRTYDNQRFSPLTQITAGNVAQLAPVAVYQMNVDRAGGLEATPVVAGGVMYVTTSYNSVLAFDLRTHKRLWQYNHRMGNTVFCCGPVNRGVAIGGDAVFMATLDAHLVALDSRTGAVKWNIVTHPADSGYSHTAAPLVIGTKVIVGVAGGEYGIRGSVTAYDTETGRQVWRFYTVPSPADGGWYGKWATTTPWGDTLPRNIAAERADTAKYPNAWKIGGAPMWTTPAYDPVLGLIYFGTGNPSPSNDGVGRPGDNLYNNSTIAIDAETGKLRWFVQHIPHDLWDYDIPNPPILATVNGRKLVLHAGKEGWVYMMDAATGATVRRSDAFVPQQHMFFAPTDAGQLMRPGIFGGANWPPASYSPATGLMYIPGRDRPCIATREDATYEPGKLFVAGGCRRVAGHVNTGVLAAVDVATGKIAWRSERETEVWSGTLATAGGVVFMGETNGWFRAFDARTGAVLWSYFCGAGPDASPVTYELDGRQYVAMPAGGIRYGNLRGNSLIIFALGSGTPSAAAAGPAQPAATRPPTSTPIVKASELPRGAVKINEYLAYDSSAKVVFLNAIGGAGGANGGMSFNGASKGGATITVPRGWTVRARFSNQDKIPHSVLVIRETTPLPVTPDHAAIPGAEGSHLAEGIAAGEDVADEFSFVAREAGRFLLACGVAGHTPSGMWIRFVVDSAARRPSYR